jgi:hypothetical protein
MKSSPPSAPAGWARSIARLGRDIALKVIPDTFALDPDRTAQRPAAHPTVEVIVRKER